MSNWIKMLWALWTDPNVMAMAKRLGCKRITVIGGLFAAWCLVDQHGRGDTVEHLSAAWLDEHVELDGFAEAMASVGWLVIRETSLVFPGYEEHNGATAKRRAAHAKRAQHAQSASALKRNPQLRSSAPEKRREEESREEQPAVVCGEPSQDDSPPPDPDASQFAFPVVGNDGNEWTLPQAKVAEYREAYPDLDLEAELRAARQWCRDNRANRKTVDGMPRFLANWLKKAQNNPSLRAKTGGASAAAAKPNAKYRPIDPPV